MLFVRVIMNICYRRLIVVAEKKVVYEKFPIPLINRLEKHFLAMDTMLIEDQRQLTDDLQHWAEQFRDTGQPQHVHQKGIRFLQWIIHFITAQRQLDLKLWDVTFENQLFLATDVCDRRQQSQYANWHWHSSFKTGMPTISFGVPVFEQWPSRWYNNLGTEQIKTVNGKHYK